MPDLVDFWQNQHRTNTGWLTGTRFDDIKTFYSLADRDFIDKHCLEIGVGRATVSRGISALASKFYCCDISEQALNKVSALADGVFLTQDINKIPGVDIVICHLVLVHCDDIECKRILSSINLTPGGRIFCQFSAFTDPDIGAAEARPDTLATLDLGNKHWFRTPEQSAAIIKDAGLSVRRVKDFVPGQYQGWYGQYWQFYELYR